MNKKWLLEKAKTPIYQRIINCLAKELRKQGQKVWIIDPGHFQDLSTFLEEANSFAPDFVLITNLESVLASYLPKPHDCFTFELLPARLVFLHHNNLVKFNEPLEIIEKRLLSWQKIKDKSCHFCLEKENLKDLQALDITNSHPIWHATEFTPCRPEANPDLDLSFVGHVLPGCLSRFNKMKFGLWLKKDYQSRIQDLTYPIAPSASNFAQTFLGSKAGQLKKTGLKYYYFSYLHAFSLQFRGDVLSRVTADKLHIFGGDPAYLHQEKRALQLANPSIVYHPPTLNAAHTKKIYARSTISLNITSLQFDTALINRTIDIAACGGFVLTDYKTSLKKGFPELAPEISFKDLQELNTKIDYYLTHPKKRKELAADFTQAVLDKCSYQKTVRKIIALSSEE